MFGVAIKFAIHTANTPICVLLMCKKDVIIPRLLCENTQMLWGEWKQKNYLYDRNYESQG
jgi:hypothetical protein